MTRDIDFESLSYSLFRIHENSNIVNTTRTSTFTKMFLLLRHITDDFTDFKMLMILMFLKGIPFRFTVIY